MSKAAEQRRKEAAALEALQADFAPPPPKPYPPVEAPTVQAVPVQRAEAAKPTAPKPPRAAAPRAPAATTGEKRKPGRPKKVEPRLAFSSRVSAAQKAELEALAGRTGKPETDLLEEAFGLLFLKYQTQ